MSFRFEPKKGQKFNIGRTINFTVCGTLSQCTANNGGCDFINCPNYAKEMVRVRDKIDEYYNSVRDNELLLDKDGHIRTWDGITEFIGSCQSFPKGTYWDTDGYGDPKDGVGNWRRCTEIRLVTKTTKQDRYYGEYGDFTTRVSVDLTGDFDIHDRGASSAQLSLARSISNKLKKLKQLRLDDIAQNVQLKLEVNYGTR